MNSECTNSESDDKEEAEIRKLPRKEREKLTVGENLNVIEVKMRENIERKY